MLFRSAGDEMSTLGAELERALAYLEILKIRMGERLSVQVEISEALRATPMPAMMLQTLVENAIKHGIAVTPEGGELDIGIECREGALHIQVGNPLPPQAAPAGHGVGLAYLRAQLGPGGHVELRPEGGRMQAHLVVPQ